MQARAVPNLKYIQANANALPFTDAVFDAVVMADVLEHLPRLQAALNEAARVLKTGGSVLVCGTAMMQKLRIVGMTFGVSDGRSLTRPLRDARRFPSTQRYSVPGATRTTLGFEICPSFKGHFLPTLALRFATCSSLYGGVSQEDLAVGAGG
jgi:SAM-dependent methyltransferase